MATTGDTLFKGVIGVLDASGRPVFVVPVALPADTKLRIRVTGKALAFYADDKLIGQVEKNIDDSILQLAAQQKEIGIIAWPLADQKKGLKCPDHLTHIATVEDAPAPAAAPKRGGVHP